MAMSNPFISVRVSDLRLPMSISMLADYQHVNPMRIESNRIALIAATHSCLSVWTSSFNFCSSESTSR